MRGQKATVGAGARGRGGEGRVGQGVRGARAARGGGQGGQRATCVCVYVCTHLAEVAALGEEVAQRDLVEPHLPQGERETWGRCGVRGEREREVREGWEELTSRGGHKGAGV